jgi:hypothetical protein
MQRRRSREIAVGQRYRKVGPGGGSWKVVAVRTDGSGAIHARMQSLDEPESFRTFSIGALADARSFQIEDET